MAKDQSGESHLSHGGTHQPSGPTRQRHQMATGAKLNGQRNPYSAPSHENTVKNQPKNY